MQAEQTKYLCGFARKQKIKAAVHTNGYYPHELRGMLTVLDAIFLDFKAPLGKYYALTKNPDAGQHLVETLKVLEDSRRYGNHIYWEIRTTIFEGLNDTPQAIREIAKYCKLADVYVVQQGRPEVCPTPEYRDKQPVSEAKLVELANAACAELDNVKIRAHTVLYGERWIKKGGIQFIPD
jgi:pyruvate-formate lyase-activating enzyme